MANRKDYFRLHFIVFLWGFSAILGKLVSIPAVEMVFYRAILAFIGIGILLAATKGSFRVSAKDFTKLFLIGFIVAVHWLSFFGSARVSNVSVSLVGFATNSLWAAVLVPWFNRTQVKKFELMLSLIVITGLYIIFSFDFQYKLGLFLGIVAGFTSALFSVFNSRIVQRIPSFTITFYEMIGVSSAIALFLPLYKILWAPGHTLNLAPTWSDWIYIGLLAGVCSIYAYSVAIELMKKLSVFFIQLTLNLEPVYGIVMAVIIFGNEEKMGWNFYLGTLLILSAVAVYPLMKRRFDKGFVLPE
jgi:drug/metabolite transporter (DMT)-like permease